ncbi:MAG: hypothetical protein RL033_5020 [Pseudomonadota bacterium]|jgi:hypothetical protein
MSRGAHRLGYVWVALLLALAASLAPSTAHAAGPHWRDDAALAVKVFEHSFQRVTANDVSCVVRVRLYFDAPASSYREAAAQRNHYRFLAQVKLSGGNSFLSDVFSNTEPGARVLELSYNTALEGCWAQQALKLRKVDVHACRGAKCQPQAF